MRAVVCDGVGFVDVVEAEWVGDEVGLRVWTCWMSVSVGRLDGETCINGIEAVCAVSLLW